MSLHKFSSDNEIERSLKEWGRKQEVPAYLRQKILNQAGAASAERKYAAKWMVLLNGFIDVYVLPRKRADLDAYLFSQAAYQTFEVGMHNLRLVS